MKTFLAIILVIVVVGAAALAAVFAIGPLRVWTTLAGPADLGPMELQSVKRTKSPHDALACSAGACGDAKVDHILPAYQSSPEELLTQIVQRANAVSQNLERVDDRSDATRARFLTFSPTMKFPDTTWVETFADADSSTGVRIYARARIGYSDRGENLKRIKAWTSNLQ